MKNTDLVPLFEMTPQGIGKWRKEKRPIISLLEKYHSKEELQEFLETGKIQKQDRLKELLEIEKKYNELKSIFESQSQQNM